MVTSKSLGKQNLATDSPSKNGNNWVLGFAFVTINSIFLERIVGIFWRLTTLSPRDSESILSTTLVASPVLDWLVVVVVVVFSTCTLTSLSVPVTICLWTVVLFPGTLLCLIILGGLLTHRDSTSVVISPCTSTPIQSVCHEFHWVEINPVLGSAPFSSIMSSKLPSILTICASILLVSTQTSDDGFNSMSPFQKTTAKGWTFSVLDAYVFATAATSV